MERGVEIMKKIGNFIVRARYWLLGVFVVLVGLSAFLMTQVNINYNLMQYLDSDSSSTVALTTMEDEFGSVGQCQVMVSDVTYSEASEIKVIISEVDGVSEVVFASSASDTEYYNSATKEALFKVFLTTGNFDTESYKTLDNIRDAVKDYTVSLNGGSVTSQFLTEALDRDMVIILIIVVLVVFVILAITSNSWVEPVIFMVIAGGAILINMGSNILLNYIPYIGNSMSFITKSIAAVMQLALSMDYSIVLLHAYREEKEKTADKKEAMANALVRSFAPVSSSSITTIAGLVALMFMSFSIGFDIGLVLAKGILLSLLSVFLFMPSLLLIFDKLLVKTSHKPIDILIHEKIQAHNNKKTKAGKKVHTIAGFQKKTRIAIPVIVLVLVIVGAIFNFNSEYDFTLKASTDTNAQINVDDKAITDSFGTQNTLVVLINKDNKTKKEIESEEEEIIAYMKNYTYNGENVINSVQGYSTYGVYLNLTSDQFAEIFLSADSLGANKRAMATLYSYMEAEGLTTTDSDGNLVANVYDVIEYATKNEGAKKITDASQTLIDQVNTVYTTKLTASEFAAANSLNSTVVNQVYAAAGSDSMTTYEVLKFVVDNNYASAAFSQVQADIDSSYSDLVNANVFNEDGSVNEVTVNAMKTYIAAVEAGKLDSTDTIVAATYQKYKTITADLNKEAIMSNYPFIDSDTADLLLNGNTTTPNYLIIQASSLKAIPTLYGNAMQSLIEAKYSQIPNRDLELTKEDVLYNYGLDSDTLDLLFSNGNITNYQLFATLSTTQYFKNEEYVNTLQSEFSNNYESFSMFESDNYIRVIFNFNMPVSSEDTFTAINEITDHLYSTYSDVEVVSESFVYSQIKDVFNQDIILVNLISFIAILLIIAITFKSYFVPVLLTVLIQGAIWVTMGVSTMTGNNIFFVCYIVVMCVQMGATIDYGILLTNNYKENRKSYGVMDSMSLAMSSSISTILTSGSILVLATLIIGLVSKVSIISDLGLLLSRGCLISVLMIIFALPQCLMLCDKLIEKTTFRTEFYKGEDGILASGKEVEGYVSGYIVDNGDQALDESKNKLNPHGSN